MKRNLLVTCMVLLTFALLVGCQPAKTTSAATKPGTTVSGTTQAVTTAPAGKILSEKEAWDQVKAGTLKGDPAAGYEYSEVTKQWYYTNFPNYKDFRKDGKIKVAFVGKFAGAWFTPKSQAMADTCKKYGYDYLFIDANSDKQAWLDGIQNVINQDFDAVVMTPVNTTLLPEAVKMLQAAGIAYLTTDDPGPDEIGFYPPHYGLDDYYLHNELGKIMAKELADEAFFKNVKDDFSNFLFVVEDSPAVEAIHKRNVGAVDAIRAAFPKIPDNRILWLDCGGSLNDEILEKFSSTFQANKSTVEYWLISGGGASGVVPTMTLFKEAGIDIENKVRMIENFSTADPMELMYQNPAVRKVTYGVGLVSYPSGEGIIEVLHKLFEEKKPIPAFTGYALNVVKDDTLDDFYNKYYKK